MIEEKVRIINPNGITARVSAVFVQSASKFTSNVWIKKEDNEVNAKSIMGLMSLALAENDDVVLKIDGTDETECIKQLKEVLGNSY